MRWLKVIIPVLTLIITLIFVIYFKGFVISGKSVFDTAAISDTVGMSISVDALPPSITLTKPENKTYLYNTSILLRVSATDSVSSVNSVWYNIDSGTNNTLMLDNGENETKFNTSQGSHNLTIYANDTFNQVNITSIRFTVNSTRSYFEWSEYNGSSKGSTTELSNTTYEDIQNFSNFTLENTNFGKIKFNENVNLTKDDDFSNTTICLDCYINISFNQIFINSSVFVGVNKSATLTLFGLSFSNPRILRDNQVCPASICTNQSYSDNTLVFNVTGFSTYSSEETPSGGAPGGTSTGGGGGGSAAITKVTAFELDTDLIKVKLEPGETLKKSLKIKNIGDTVLNLNIDLFNLENFLIFPGGVSTYSIKLEPKKERILQLIFNVATDQKAGVYPGKILISGEGMEKFVTTIIEAIIKAIFDVRVDVLPQSKHVGPGDVLYSEIKIFNLGQPGRLDVNLEYGVKDLKGNVITNVNELVAVETQLNIVRNLIIPLSLKEGTYVAYVIVKYKDTASVGSDTFDVVKKGISLMWIVVIILGALVLVLVGFFVYILAKLIVYIEHPELVKAIKPLRRLTKQIRPPKRPSIGRGLREQLRILEEGYKAGIISREAYLKDKEKLMERLNRKNI